MQQDKTKHIEVDRCFIKEKIENKVVFIPFVSLKSYLANIFTKVVPLGDFQQWFLVN